jgi:membrane-bound lytic murein transglycosylase D
MANPMNLSLGLFQRIALAAIFLGAASSCLLSQEVSLSRQSISSAGRPFFVVDNSLSRSADTLLAYATQAPLPVTGKTEDGRTASILSDLHGQQPSQPLGKRGLSVSELRLNLLRLVVDPILMSHGVPVNLAAVILVESGGRATALSPKGARGLWQLMPDTARRYGLRVDEIRDDRLDLFKATDAAAQYLHDLYAQFGDWKLALAAYNTGEANVGAAILKAHTQDFDQLTSLRMLPLETRNYVPRVLATSQLIGQSSTPGGDRSLASVTVVFAFSGP